MIDRTKKYKEDKTNPYLQMGQMFIKHANENNIKPIARVLINMILTIARIFNPCQQKSANKISQKVIIFSSARNYAGLNNDLEVILLDLL